jgi:hypothetical protein
LDGAGHAAKDNHRAMTKGEIISIIRQRKSGGIPDRTNNIKYDDRVIQKYMDFVLENLLNEYIKTSNITDDFLRVFYPPIQWDNKRNYAFVKIPASMVQLPDNLGLQWISGAEDTMTQWTVSKSGLSSVYNRVGATGLTGGWVVHIEGDRIIIHDMPKYMAKGCVKIKIICGTNGYAMDEEFKVCGNPAVFIDMVCKLMDEIKLTPLKTGNDGNVNAP